MHAHASADAVGDAQQGGRCATLPASSRPPASQGVGQSAVLPGIAGQAYAERLAALEDELDQLRAHVASCVPPVQAPAGEVPAPEVIEESPSEGACVVPGPLAAYPLVSHDMLTNLKRRFKRQCWECKYGVCVRQKNGWFECRIPKGFQGNSGKSARKRALGHDGPDFDQDSRGEPSSEQRSALRMVPLPARLPGHRVCHKCQKSSALECTCYVKK